MQERTEGLLTGILLGVFLGILGLVLFSGSLSLVLGAAGGSSILPISSKSNFEMTLYIYHQENGTVQVLSDHAFWLPTITVSGNDDFGTPLGYCKVMVFQIRGLHIDETSHIFQMTPDSATCG